MSLHMFTYGSLMFAPVWRRVVTQTYHSGRAELADHARYAVNGETYPGLIARVGNCVRGIVYFDVQPQDLGALDIFEGADYRRETVAIRLEADGSTVEAETYIYCDEAALAQVIWNPDEFDIASFMNRYCATGPVNR